MRILLSGCSSGIGLATARHLLAQGHEVMGVSRREPPCQSARFRWLKADLGALDTASVWLTEGSAVDAFVHAAGVMYSGLIENYDDALAARMWALHVAAPSRLLKALRDAQAPLKRIVLIGSRTQQGAVGKSVYAASKAAQQGLIRSWALELMASGVTVNLVAPGATRTPMLEDPARAGVAPKLPPMGRFIEPEEIAASVAFLLGDEARSITGQTLTVCAGASL
ncbi:SDR family oxidoreductase [Halomonas sp. MCCC 1A11036]|uniref:SDR family oxidoreductase n=1 Tax=Billgrantia zhangzhouensis TaxID=2733481 RepID=A0ABS9AFS0_9GAMM|nr:SDR family oxidoreductase [Halomonas zhangzhouensis]MCE8020570.1 SDR family oxidoreductase [Halomonas zhangzhouensis]